MFENSTDKKFVLNADIFRGIEPKIIEEISERLISFSFHDDKLIYEQGDISSSLYFLSKGVVDICAFSLQGKEFILYSVKPPQFFGHVGFLDGDLRESTAIARSYVEGFSIKRSDFMSVLEKIEYTGWISILTALCQETRKLNVLAQNNALLSPYAKVIEKIINLCEQTSPFQKNHMINISHEKLGKMLDLTRESINKYLSALEKEDLVFKSRGVLSIPDLPKLRLYKERIIHD